MVSGLFKSSFLHLIIILMFMYGAEIFKRNKKFEIVEIPMEIIEISEKTVSTKKAPKPEVKPNRKQNYSPPEVLSRPKSPEFTKKEEKIAEPKKVKEKKSKDLSKAESILKSIEKINKNITFILTPEIYL